MGYSRFFLCDLQVHTPADARQGYGNAGGREPNEAFAERLVQAHAAAGVEVMAVSDHNRVDWYPVLKAAGEQVGVFVFPAVEFSVNRCHLLAIWDRTDEAYELAQRFITSLWGPGVKRFAANGDPHPVGRGQVLELASEAADHKAIVVAPHATLKDMGIFASGVCTNRRTVVSERVLAGYDVWGNRSADVLKNPAAEFGELPPVWFMSGDVRSFEDIGKRAVYLKLGETPTLEGIRQAFLVPQTRIRFPAALEPQWGHTVGVRFVPSVVPSWPRVNRVRIEGGFHDKLEVEFGPGLNAIIGGKGTGKSTLIEIVRHVLHAAGGEQDAHANRAHNFRANAEASIEYIDSAGNVFEVKRTGSEDPGRLLRDGAEVAVEVQRRVAVRVFGQRELQALAEKADLLREFVAAEAGAEWTDTLGAERDASTAIKAKDNDLASIETDLANLEEDELELADLKDKIATANAHGAADQIARLSALGAADSAVQAAGGWPAEVSAAVETLGELLPMPEVPEEVIARADIVAALEPLAKAAEASLSNIRAAVVAAESALVEPTSRWAAQHKDERADIEKALADAGLGDPRELSRIQARARELEGKLSGIAGKRTKSQELWTQRSAELVKLAEARRRKSRLVEAAAKALNGRVGERVRIKVDPLADRTEFGAALTAALRGQSVQGEQLRKLSEDHTPATLATAIRAGTNAVEALGCTATTASKLCGLDPSDVRRIEETDTPDRIVVEVNLAGSEGTDAWQDIVDVSPGQRATALLALALAGGSEPLIIDQPEDDLDNRYIYDEVVKVLAEVCRSRQVIVATHNANIPVLGDAELVLALDAEASQGRVLACGGLEDASVAEWSRKILEGGEAAFHARYRRYQAARR